MSGVYSLNAPGFRLGGRDDQDPTKIYYPDVDGNWPAGIPGTPGELEYIRPGGYWSGDSDWETQVSTDFSQDYLLSDPTGRNTSDLIGPDGTVFSALPPGGESFILGPLIDGFVPNHTSDAYTNIGYIQKDTRQFVLLARISGQWKNGLNGSNFNVWNGTSTGLTIYNQYFTLEMAQWIRDKILADSYVVNVPYFYSGGVPQIPQSVANCPNCPPGMYGGNGIGPRQFGSGGDPSIGTQQSAPTKGGPNDAGFPWGLLDKLGINPGTLGQLGADLLRAFTDSSRFAGDFMFKGLPKGVDYLPNFTGAAQKGLAAALTGGKKWADVFGDFGKTLAGKNYATQYFTPSLEKSLDYAKAGGTVVVMPSTPGVQGLKNWFGGGISRGFALGEVEKLVRTSDTIQSFNQGTTQIFNLANPNSMVELQKLAAQGAKTNTMLGKLGRAVPFVGAAAAIADVGMRIQSGDYAGAVLGGVSAIPGPIGWAGLGLQVLYDTTAPQGIKNYLNKDLPKFYGLSNSIQIKGNFIIEQKEDEYLNSMRQALFELGVPKNRKEYAAQQGTLLSLMDVNPQLVSIIAIALAGESFSPEQQQWIKNNMIPMVEMFSALRKIQASGENSGEVKEAFVLSENRRKILREIKKPVKIEEPLPQKLKNYRPNFAGKYTPQNTPDVTASKESDDMTKAKNAAGQTWRLNDKHWSRYESAERMNIVYDNIGHGSQYWDMIVNQNKRDIRDKAIQEYRNIIAHNKAMLSEDSTYQSPFENNIKEQETIRADQDPLFKKVSKRLKKEIDYPDKPAKNGYPNDPPPEMVNGMHPDLVDGKKIADRFNRLDPQSAKSMPSTGNPHIDKKVKAATKKPK